jgi:hypothetical protein
MDAEASQLGEARSATRGHQARGATADSAARRCIDLASNLLRVAAA